MSRRSLARSDARHVVVFAEGGKILVQLLHTLLMSLHAFSLESFVELGNAVSLHSSIIKP